MFSFGEGTLSFINKDGTITEVGKVSNIELYKNITVDDAFAMLRKAYKFGISRKKLEAIVNIINDDKTIKLKVQEVHHA